VTVNLDTAVVAPTIRAAEVAMGDRRMAEIKTTDGSFYVYTHWHGSRLPQMAADALALAEARRGDECYALRIVVDQITKDSRDSETGFGLMLKPNAEDSYNGDVPSVTIDLVAWTVTAVGS
jgi:hypothetical protein